MVREMWRGEVRRGDGMGVEGGGEEICECIGWSVIGWEGGR